MDNIRTGQDFLDYKTPDKKKKKKKKWEYDPSLEEVESILSGLKFKRRLKIQNL